MVMGLSGQEQRWWRDEVDLEAIDARSVSFFFLQGVLVPGIASTNTCYEWLA